MFLCGFIPINLNSKPLFCFTNELHFHTLFHTDFPLLYRIYFFVSCAVRTGPTKDTGLARQCQTCVMQEIWQNVQPSWQRFTFGNLCRSSDSIRDGSPEKPIGAPWVGTFILSVAGQSVCECVFFFLTWNSHHTCKCTVMTGCCFFPTHFWYKTFVTPGFFHSF